MPRNAQRLWRMLLRRRLPADCLEAMLFTCFGLGDSSYPRFNWAVRKLQRRLGQLGATEFYPTGESDELHPDGVDGTFLPWSAGLRAHLLATYPLPSGLAPVADDEPLPARYSLASAFESHLALASTAVTRSPAPLYFIPPIPDAWIATLVANDRVTPPAHWQDVRLLSLELDKRRLDGIELCLSPGDCLTLYPSNHSQDVDVLIEMMDWAAVADTPLDITAVPTLPAALRPYLSHDRQSTARPRPTLRLLLTHAVDVSAVPRRSFISAIAPFASDLFHRERLLELAAPENTNDLHDYTSRPRRTILEVLAEFSSVRVPAALVLDVFPVLRGRDFSVAGYRDVRPGVVRVQLLVALVKYRTILRKPREGLCSRYVAPLQPGARLRLTHHPSPTAMLLPQHSTRPIVAIATGTGIAPIRALLSARLSLSPTAPPPLLPPPTVLFFGSRNRAADFYFADEWDAVRAVDPLRLRVIPAFSRDQAAKVYVQDAIRAHPDLVARLVGAGAVFCLCGGSARMAEACRAAVRHCVLVAGMPQSAFDALTWWQEIW